LKQSPIPAESIPLPEKKSQLSSAVCGAGGRSYEAETWRAFWLEYFGVNLTQLAPGAISALLHRHSKQDEFIYILEGSPTLLLGNDGHLLKPGDCMGFKVGNGIAHQLINRTSALVTYLEAGDRTVGDEVDIPRTI
jgi:uncharacterized cupin superfamily protein